MFEVSFDPAAIKEIAALAGFGALLAEETQEAMREGGELLAKEAERNTWRVFEKPTGVIAASIHPVVQSPYEIIIGASARHARRREKGFSGRTDRLGRYFAHDPGKPYMQPAMDTKRQEVLLLMDKAIQRAIERIGG